MISLMEEGYSRTYVAGIVPFISRTFKRIFLTEQYLDQVCKVIFGGKTYTQKMDEVLSENIDKIIERGYITIPQIASKLKGITISEVFNFLAKYKRSYLMKLMRSYMYKMSLSSRRLISRVRDSLGLQESSQDSFKRFYLEYFGSAKFIVSELFSDSTIVEEVKRFDIALAVRALKSCNSARELLTLLGYNLADIDVSSTEVQEALFKELFNGLSISEAFLNYAFKIL